MIYGRSLGLSSSRHKVSWKGTSGMRSGGLLVLLSELFAARGSLDMLIIHLGENDLAPLSRLTLLKQMTKDLLLLNICGWVQPWSGLKLYHRDIGGVFETYSLDTARC